MTLKTILALAQEARTSAHARRVLHDALLERYGSAYEARVDAARAIARERKQPVILMLEPAKLADYERIAPSMTRTKRAAAFWLAFRAATLRLIQHERRSGNYDRSQVVPIVSVRPGVARAPR